MQAPNLYGAVFDSLVNLPGMGLAHDGQYRTSIELDAYTEQLFLGINVLCNDIVACQLEGFIHRLFDGCPPQVSCAVAGWVSIPKLGCLKSPVIGSHQFISASPRHDIAMALSLKKINAELLKGGHTAMLGKGDGYFYFWGGETVNWLERTVRVPTLKSFTLDQWLNQFHILEEKNRKLLSGKVNEKDFKEHLVELAEGKPEAEHTHGGVP